MPELITRPVPDVDYAHKVRPFDPDTSWDAAAQQTRTTTELLQDRLYAILSNEGPMTDDELHGRYEVIRQDHDEWRKATPQSVRSRRSELETATFVKWDGETKRPSNQGSPSRVWAVKK